MAAFAFARAAKPGSAGESERSICRARHPRAKGRRTFSRAFKAGRRITRAESDQAFRTGGFERLDRPHGLHRRRRRRSFFSSGSGVANLERSARKRKVIGYSPLRARRPRYFASGNVLSAEWLRPL